MTSFLFVILSAPPLYTNKEFPIKTIWHLPELHETSVLPENKNEVMLIKLFYEKNNNLTSDLRYFSA